MGTIGELKSLKERRDAGGAAAQFKGADRATVATAKQQAEATLKAIAIERGKQNKIWNAINPIGVADRNERELILRAREKSARATAGLDLNKYKAATAAPGLITPEITGSTEGLAKGAGGGGGGAKGGNKAAEEKAALDAKLAG